MTFDPRPYRRFSFDWLSAREEGWTYGIAADADPETCETVYAFQEGEADDDPPSVAHIDSALFTPAERAALPRVRVATGWASDDAAFTIELEFVFDPATGIYAYQSTDDNRCTVDSDVGYSFDEGVTEWAEAHAGLCAAGENYAADLSDLSTFEDEDGDGDGDDDDEDAPVEDADDARVDLADRLVSTRGAEQFQPPNR